MFCKHIHNSMRRNRMSAASSDNRIQDFITKTPLVTLSLLAFNISIHVFIFLSSWNIGPYTYNPARVLYSGEYYRMFTAAFIHAGIMHIGMNMMSLMALGGVLEPAFGSIRFFWLTLVVLIWEGVISTFISWVWVKVMNDPSFLFSNSVGFSGVLFAYAIIEAFHSYETSRSLFGVISFPTKIYPFALLIVLQVILPNVSLIGHLGGILAGMLLMTTIGYRISMLPQSALEAIENFSCFGPIKRLSSYRLVTTKEMIHSSLEMRDTSSMCGFCCSSIGNLFMYILTFFWQLFVTIGHVLGIPADRCQGWGNQGYYLCCQYPYQVVQQVGGCISTTWTSLWTGGYTAVATEEDGISSHGQRDVEIGARFPSNGGRTLGTAASTTSTSGNAVNSLSGKNARPIPNPNTTSNTHIPPKTMQI